MEDGKKVSEICRELGVSQQAFYSWKRRYAGLGLNELDRLQSLAHQARSQALLALRARVMLACAEGLDNKAVAKKLRCSMGMVVKWRSRFLRARLEGLYDEPRPGAPRKVSDAQVEQVVIQTLETTPRGETHWSTRGLAKASGLSRMTISRIWQAFGLQPHRSETFKLSQDPQLIEKVRNIVGNLHEPARSLDDLWLRRPNSEQRRTWICPDAVTLQAEAQCLRNEFQV